MVLKLINAPGILTERLASKGITSKLIVPIKQIEDGIYGDLIIIYPEPYSIYLGGGYKRYPLLVQLPCLQAYALNPQPPLQRNLKYRV